MATVVEFGTYYSQYNVSFTAGDVFRVSVEGGVVKYKKNGVVYHTSPGIPTYPLKVDSALYTSNSTLTNAVVGGNWSGGSAGGGSSSSSEVLWLVADHLGTPRMILDQSGSLANIKRHGYLPFGEELFACTGGRTQQQGYTANDNVRQKFTGHQRDNETALDYLNARYYSSSAGRFTSSDTFGGRISNPQTLNLFSYVINNPLRWIDPTGHFQQDPTDEADPNKRHVLDGNNQIFEVDENDKVTEPHSIGSERVTVDGSPPELAPSFQDWIPIWGGFRRMLFYNHTGQPERALMSFLGASIEGGTGTAPAVIIRRAGLSALQLTQRAIVREAIAEADVVAGRALLASVDDVTPNAGGVIRSFVAEGDQVYFRVFSESPVGGFLTAVPPRSGAFAREALSLPSSNQATFIQEVIVPAGTRLQRSRALPAFGRRGGAEQYQLLDRIPFKNFGPRRPL